MGKYLKFYEKYRSTELPQWGLCGCFPCDETLKLFAPTGFEELDSYYWGIPDEITCLTMEQRRYEFTSLRKTIVLLMAAMNEEL